MVCVEEPHTALCEECHIILTCFTQVNKSRTPFIKLFAEVSFFVKCSGFVFYDFCVQSIREK